MTDVVDRPTGPSDQRLVIVAGSGRSGTSMIAGVLKNLGLHVPQPEVPANRTNPRGFFEPAWVVDFQRRLLDEVHVPLFDARPQAFSLTERVGQRPAFQDELQAWLAGQVAAATEVVIKDPRNTWFLPMWRTAAERVGTVPGVLMMVRHPAEVVGSHKTYYRGKQPAKASSYSGTNRTANWINLTLATEKATRASPRAFLRYVDLLTNWRTVVSGAAESLDLSMRRGMSDEAVRAVDAFVDPDLHRVQVTWDEVDAPSRLTDLAEEVWAEMGRLVDSGGGNSETALDQLREAYADLYAQSEAIAQSSIRAAGHSPRAAGPGRRRKPTEHVAEAETVAPDLTRAAGGSSGVAKRAMGRLRGAAGGARSRIRDSKP